MDRGSRIIVLAKPPLPGRCKSRLAADIGSGPATRLARAFLADTWSAVSAFVSARPELDLMLAQAGEPGEFPLLLPSPSTVRQGSGDLGRRMATLVAGAFDQRDRVLLLGTDSPGLPLEHLNAALAAQSGADLVLGAHEDGGFWCLGARAGHAALNGNTWLDDLDWERDDTLAQVRERARRLGVAVAEAPGWFDVDRGADIDRLRGVLWADTERAPETRRALDSLGQPEPLSIVVVALNESIGLDYCLDTAREQPGPLELIVADGGSHDRSPERAAAGGATVMVSPPGRGRQLRAGAAAATGDVLMFLHADVILPPGATRIAREALDDGHEAGAFLTHHVADPNLPNYAGPLLRLADLRSRYTRRPYGDQALFVTRRAYDAVGGFADLPLFEDYDLSRRLARRAPLARVREEVRVSGRRIQSRPLRSAFMLSLLPVLFRLGVSAERLARLYHG